MQSPNSLNISILNHYHLSECFTERPTQYSIISDIPRYVASNSNRKIRTSHFLRIIKKEKSGIGEFDLTDSSPAERDTCRPRLMEQGVKGP